MLKLENSIRGLSFSRVAFDLTIQDIKKEFVQIAVAIVLTVYGIETSMDVNCGCIKCCNSTYRSRCMTKN